MLESFILKRSRESSIKTMNSETVVLVHGVGLRGAEIFPLRCRLQKFGYKCLQFSYAAWRNSLSENAASLNKFLVPLEADVIHFVGHSLGGLVIFQLFADYCEQRPGRIVTLGTPHNGSRVADKLKRTFFGKFLLGRTVMTGLGFGKSPPIPAKDVGVIAGSLDIGSGWLMGVPRPNDSLIAVDETQVAGIKNHIVLPVSHTGLLITKSVARQTHAFLQTGHFFK